MEKIIELLKLYIFGESLKTRVLEVAVAAKHKKIQVTFFCAIFSYNGVPVEVTREFIVLRGAKFTPETGPFADKKWAKVEEFPHDEWTIMVSAIESFGLIK
jgi:hypothetical protein